MIVDTGSSISRERCILETLGCLPWKRYLVVFPNIIKAHVAICWHGTEDQRNLGLQTAQHLVSTVFLPRRPP